MAAPIRIVLVEDNHVFREALELLLGLQADMQVVASVGDGNAAVAAVHQHNPDAVVMDYRLPGLDGVQATKAVRAAAPGAAVVCLTASADHREIEALYEAGAVACLWKDQELDEIVRTIRRAVAERVTQVDLDATNTAIVLDSTADFPDAPKRFPNWRVVPLYVRFGVESFKDYVELTPEEFYARLRTSEELPTTSQPTPADFLAAYRELAAYDRIYSLHISGDLSGTFGSATTAGRELGDDKVRTIDTGTASAAVAMLGLAIQRRLERGTTDEEIARLIERYEREAGLIFSVETLEFLRRGGRIGRARAWAGQLLNVKPILTIKREVIPLKRVRGNQKAMRVFVDEFTSRSENTPSLRVGIAHAAAPERARQLEKMVRGERPQAQIDLVTDLGAVVGTHAGPGTVGFFWFDDVE